MKNTKKNKKEIIKELKKTIVDSEIEFLKYLIRCCENILEDRKIMGQYTPFIPPMMQLIKLRAEVTTRLEGMGIKYGKFAEGRHLLSKNIKR